MTTTVSCERCGGDIPVRARGPRPRYCGDACRQAAHRGAPGRPAAEAAVDVPEPTAVTSFALRSSRAVDYGDGDWCPQDDGHGRMFFVDQAKSRQWCPHSGHRGNAIYQRDGLTPAPPAGPDLVSSASVGVKQGQAQPAAPVDLGGAANPTTGNQPSPAGALTADLDGAGQLSLALGTAT